MSSYPVDAKHLKHVTLETESHRTIVFLRESSAHRDAKIRARVRRENR